MRVRSREADSCFITCLAVQLLMAGLQVQISDPRLRTIRIWQLRPSLSGVTLIRLRTSASYFNMPHRGKLAFVHQTLQAWHSHSVHRKAMTR